MGFIKKDLNFDYSARSYLREFENAFMNTVNLVVLKIFF